MDRRRVHAGAERHQLWNPSAQFGPNSACRDGRVEPTGCLEDDASMRYVQSSSFVADDGALVVDVVFLCRYRSGEPTPQPGEVAAVLWLTAAQQFARPDLPPWHAASLRKVEAIRAELDARPS